MNAALALRELVAYRRCAGAAPDTPEQLLMALSAGLAAVVDLHHPDPRGRCAACAPRRAPWAWVVRNRWPCPVLRAFARELDSTINAPDPCTT